LKRILIWYTDWKNDGRHSLEITTLPDGKDLKEFLDEWQKAVLEQDLILLEAYTITEQHNVYGKHEEIARVETVEPVNTKEA
jgi:hypothetical protein